MGSPCPAGKGARKTWQCPHCSTVCTTTDVAGTAGAAGALEQKGPLQGRGWSVPVMGRDSGDGE